MGWFSRLNKLGPHIEWASCPDCEVTPEQIQRSLTDFSATPTPSLRTPWEYSTYGAIRGVTGYSTSGRNFLFPQGNTINDGFFYRERPSPTKRKSFWGKFFLQKPASSSGNNSGAHLSLKDAGGLQKGIPPRWSKRALWIRVKSKGPFLFRGELYKGNLSPPGEIKWGGDYILKDRGGLLLFNALSKMRPTGGT